MRRIWFQAIWSAILLAGCSGGQKDNTDGQAANLETDTASTSAPAVVNSAAPSAAPTPSKAVEAEAESGQDEVAPAKPIRYSCENGKTAIAEYVESGTLEKRVNLEVDGNLSGLALTKSASGARYESEGTTPAGKIVVWWTKGREATLSERDPKTSEDDAIVVKCQEVSNQ